MGKIKKFGFRARTLDEESVKDGLEAVSVLNDKEPYFLVGGIATQSYLPTRCRRPTSDIDFSLVRPLSKSAFRAMASPIQERLKEMGYESETKTTNRSRSYALNFQKQGKCDGALCLEFVRRNEENFNKHSGRLKREYDNSKQKIIEGRESIYRVCSPEDVAVPKLLRSINSLGRNTKFLENIPFKLESFSDEGVKKIVRDINQIREEAVANPGDPYLAERLRFVSDIYDIRMLSEITGFNQEYFMRAEEDWNDIGKNPELRDKIFDVALPMFLENKSN